MSWGELYPAGRGNARSGKAGVKQFGELLAKHQPLDHDVIAEFVLVEIDVELAGGQKNVANRARDVRIAGVAGQPRQFGNHFHNGAVGVDDVAVLGADVLDGFGDEAPRLVRRLRQVVLVQMLPGAVAEVLDQGGVLLGRADGIRHRVGPVVGGGQAAGYGGGHRGGGVGGGGGSHRGIPHKECALGQNYSTPPAPRPPLPPAPR